MIYKFTIWYSRGLSHIKNYEYFGTIVNRRWNKLVAREMGEITSTSHILNYSVEGRHWFTVKFKHKLVDIEEVE